MRDDHYRNLCEYPPDYDKVIDLIKRENGFCNAMAEAEREDFAVQSVHSCIRAVVFGDAGSYCSTGCAIAIRASNNTGLPTYKKVKLALVPYHTPSYGPAAEYRR